MSEERIKALLNLMLKEPQFQKELRLELAKLIKEHPVQFKHIIAQNYGGAVPLFVTEIVNHTHRAAFAEAFKGYFNLRNPDLMRGFCLIAKFINPSVTDAALAAALDPVKEALEREADSSFDIHRKAEAFRSVFFDTLGFKPETLNNDDKLLSLPDIVKTRRVSGFALGVLYLLAAEGYEVLADITDVAGKPVVRLRDNISFEPIYIDITARGRFVSEDECRAYAQSRGLEWSGKMIKPYTSKEIIKRLLGNLVYAYSKAPLDAQNANALPVLREIMGFIK